MKACLAKIDMYGTSAKLNTFGEESYKTSCGGILSILTVLTTVFFSYLFGTDFYHRENPGVVQQEKILKTTQPFYLKSAKHPFMIKLSTGMLINIDLVNYPLKLQGTFWHFKKDESGNWKNTLTTEALAPCNQTKVTENLEIAQSNKLHEWYCIDFEKVTEEGRKTFNDSKYEAHIKGFTDEDEMVFFRFDVRNYFYDVKTQLRSNITSYEEISKLYDIMVNVKYPNSFFNADAKENPLETQYKQEDVSLKADTWKFARQFMNRLTINDDRSWIFKDISTSEGLTPESNPYESNQNEYITKKHNNLYSKLFYLGKKDLSASRNYMKVQELSALVGGFVKIVVLNFTFISKIYSGFYIVVFYLWNLTNRSIKIDSRVGENQPVDLSANINNYTDFSTISQTKKSLKKIELNIFSYYFRFCRKMSKEQQEDIKAFNSAEAYINERLDIKYLLEHYEKFETLCEMMLTNEQKEILSK